MIAATLSATIYSLLTIAALLSTVSPTLTSLSSHGKTRALSHNGDDSNTNTRCHDQPSLLRRWLRYHLVDNHRMTVNKCRFIDFYVTGIIVSTMILICNVVASRRNVCIMSRGDIVSTSLLYVHLVRRYGECKWVHKSGALSQMHIAGYLLGILHYLCLPFLLIPYHQSSYNLACTLHNSDNPFQGGDIDGRQCHDSSPSSGILQSTSMKVFLNALAIIGCIYFQYQQHRHHVILANLRGVGDSMSSTKTTKHYAIPTGGWFEYVSCPHYFSEIMIYITFAVLMNDGSFVSRERNVEAWISDCHHYSTTPTRFCGSLADNSLMDLVISIHRSRNWILCIWVATNQAISAYRTHEWYCNSFGPAYPQQRKKLVAFIW
jgi:3-oxo-5-alpha-steroid 4-dehydrogenase 3